MNLVYIIITILSLATAIVSLISKLKWTKELREAKNAQIKFLEEKVEHYKEINSSELMDHFKSRIQEYEQVHSKLKSELKEIKESAETSKNDDKEIAEMDIKVRESLKEKEILLAEIHHRLKNNLAIISGMIQMKVFNSDNEDFKNEMEEVRFKILSIAKIHELLFQSEHFDSVSLKTYLSKLGDLYEMNITVLSNSKYSLNINRIIPLSIIVNEIISSLQIYGIKEITVYTKNTEDNIDLGIKVNNEDSISEIIEESSHKIIHAVSEHLGSIIKFDDHFEISIPFQSNDYTNKYLNT